jgi:hypothetical protein
MDVVISLLNNLKIKNIVAVNLLIYALLKELQIA